VTAVGGLFFPQRKALGLDSRHLTPGLVKRVVWATAESRSYERAVVVLKQVGGNPVSCKTVARVAGAVGGELAELRDQAPSRTPAKLAPKPPEEPPKLAVVQCDGGRIRTRQPGHGPGVHEPAWRETKNACLVKMTHRTFSSDPQPELPACFRDPAHVAELAEAAVPEGLESPASADPVVEAAPPEKAKPQEDWRPKRLVRTCVASLAEANSFGRQMHRESRRRRFDEAPARAFLGDGLPWNWTIWKKHFRRFVPILDFVHVLSYLFRAALACPGDVGAAWERYLEWAQACWAGRVAEVLGALRQALRDHDVDPEQTLDEQHPCQPVLAAHRYLTNHQSRMDYAEYRRQGLPVTTALMESLVKQVNQRVKGTEMFWNDPEGAEAILQIRAAALCDDDRLDLYLAHRPGQPYVRRATARYAA